MSNASGWLRKMSVTLDGGHARYAMSLKDQNDIALNDFIGKHIQLHFTGNIQCIACDRMTKKSFNQGYCFPCAQALAACDVCIVKPEICHHHKGTCREPEWGNEHCMIGHYVYLANTTGVKVGLTRMGQLPTRWLDQGAIAALPIFKAKTRRHAGFIEFVLTRELNDKTQWRDLLRNRQDNIDLLAIRDEMFSKFKLELKAIDHSLGVETQFLQQEVTEINYPVASIPHKVISLNPLKQPTIEGELLGIRGQYLLFEQGGLNIRKMTGHEVKFDS